MRDAGYTGFERGIRGSTDEHLSVVEYKVQQEQERLRSTKTQATKSQFWLDEVEDRIRQIRPVYEEIQNVDSVGKKKLFGNRVGLTSHEFDKLTALAKFGIKSQPTIDNLEGKIRELTHKYNTLNSTFDKLKDETTAFTEAVREEPERVISFISDVLIKAKEAREAAIEQEKLAAERQKAVLKARRESPWMIKVQPSSPKSKIRGSYDRDSR
jgi:chromosome segregation ATPase